jgi:hypothetical protein
MSGTSGTSGTSRARTLLGRRPALRVAWVAALLALAALCVVTELAPSTSAGYVAKITNSTDTAATAPYFSCADAVTADKASALFAYKLNEASGSTTAVDYDSGAYPGTYRGTMTSSTATPLACPRDAGGAYVLNGTNAYVSTPYLSLLSAQSFSLELWFKTTTPSGMLMGLGNLQTGSSTVFDRHIYLSTTGQLVFGVYNLGYDVITSPASYTDGNWHQVVATFSGTTGERMYVDGALVASNASYTLASLGIGYWRIGYDNLAGWPGTGTNYFFTGSMRFAAVYNTTLTQAQVTSHYAAGR